MNARFGCHRLFKSKSTRERFVAWRGRFVNIREGLAMHQPSGISAVSHLRESGGVMRVEKPLPCSPHEGTCQPSSGGLISSRKLLMELRCGICTRRRRACSSDGVSRAGGGEEERRDLFECQPAERRHGVRRENVGVRAFIRWQATRADANSCRQLRSLRCSLRAPRREKSRRARYVLHVII